MQSSFFNNVRSTASQIPRAISPHLTSPTSSSSASIRSLSPSRHSYIRSRSASPSPRRFASVLAYHATPPPESHNKNKAKVNNSSDDSSEHNTLSSSSDHFRGRDGSNGNSNSNRALRDDSPSRIAVRNLEESWRRFELETASSAAASPPLSSTSSFGSPTLSSSSSSPTSGLQSPARVGSPSPLSRQPVYKELIECESLSEKKEAAATAATTEESSTASSRTASSGTHGKNKSTTTTHNDIKTKHDPATVTTSSSSPLVAANSSRTNKSDFTKSRHTTPLSAATSENPNADREQQPHSGKNSSHDHDYHKGGYRSAFLASSEARHILDLPSLLGQDPNRISDVLPMAHGYLQQPHDHHSHHHHHHPTPSSSSTTTSSSALQSKLLTDLGVKADKTAEEMTERYSAKNINMTETEAHRMVHILANEVVALHAEAEKMRAQIDQARQDMLEAARLLRMKAAREEQVSKEMQEYSSHTAEDDVQMTKRQQREDEERTERERLRSAYDKDEWNE
ncbi:hypothetical protein BGZ83_010998 [Gryganskiella cystojenkinii]|nr:hypothetical protein BGZ83_010998 [Gryganskiella cystojenkinii]